MTRTVHGHHIPGTVDLDPTAARKVSIFRCGGLQLCSVCRDEAGANASPREFLSKIVIIEAVQFTGGAMNANRIIDWVLEHDGTATWMEAHEAWVHEGGDEGYAASPEQMTIRTLEGNMKAPVGWWIIRGLEGEFYPCAPSIFEAKYEEKKIEAVSERN